MNKKHFVRPRRLAALLLALMMALAQVAAFAAQAQQEVSVTLNYTQDGTPMSVMASPVGYPGYENALWLYVSPEAQADPNAALFFTDITGVTAHSFSIPSGTLASSYYMYNAEGNLLSQPVEFYTLDELGNPVNTYMLYLSLSQEMPNPPQAEVMPADITVYYVDENNQPIASEVITLQPGANTVRANLGLLPEGYTPIGSQEYTINVTEFGADMSEVTFIFEAPALATEVPVMPADITVYYVDENNQPIASEVIILQPGVNTVRANPGLLPEGYTPIGSQEYTVNVTEFGADMGEVTFMFEAPAAPTEVPVIPVDITVYYVDENNQPIASEVITLQPGANTVRANPGLLPEGYIPIGTQEYIVNVTEFGADMGELTFMFEAPAVPTEAPVMPADITVYYVDENNQPLASEVITLQPGANTVRTNPGLLPEGYTPIGTQEYIVNVTEFGADMSEVTFMFEAPAVSTEEPIPPVTISVLYQDHETGRQVADPQQVTLQPGTTTVSPDPANLEPGYVQTGQSVYHVTVDISGADLDPVIFVYKLETAVSRPVDVVVSYVDENGNKVASDTVLTLNEGQNPVTANPMDLMEGYALLESEDTTKYVTVTQNTATPPSLSFVYRLVAEVSPTPPPAPKAALVNVLYKNEAGDILYSTSVPCKEGENNVIAVDLNQVNQQIYQLISEPEVIITVDAEGNPSQQEVVFLFKDITVKSATITVHYRDEAGSEVSPSQTVTIQTGTWQVQAKPDKLPEGCTLISEGTVTVSLSPAGVLSREDVVFVYAKPATPTPEPTASPEPTVLPFDIKSMDEYAYPIKDGINFRSSPDSASKDNIISVVNAKDLAHILGSVKNRQGEEWYLTDINGQEGFLKATVARVLTFNEAAALFNWTPTPAPEPSPSNDPMTDGEVIDRWAQVNSAGGVNLRSKTSTSSTRLATLENGERFWVYTQKTVNKVVWYSVLVNGKAGFVQADYARLFTKEESETYQASLPSPMPYQTTPTPKVTATATPEVIAPTATPKPAQTTAPAVYQGPALTTIQAELRTGMNRQNEPVIEILPANTLVQVWNQTWIGNEGISQVQVMADKQVGYVPTSSLRYINEQEASYYLAQLQPKVSATPSPTRPLVQMTGFAISRGENVPLRAFTDTNAKIVSLIPEGAIVSVSGQEYVGGTVWHVVQHGTDLGYVREDQLRMLTPSESENYLNSLRTPIPQPVTTPIPITLDSPSSYGYVSKDRVRLRSEPSTKSREIKLLSKNAFALVYGSSVQADGTWYHVSHNGTIGYIHGDYFKVLPMGDLSSYLQSQEFLNANNQSSSSTGIQASGQITPLENYNTSVWQNPSLINASYEPFNPLGSPTPPIEAILTPSPTPEASPSPTLMTVEGFEQPPEKADSGLPTGLIVVGVLALLGGGGYYAYHLYNQNQKRAAQRAAERRAQAARQAGQPQTRPAQPSPYAPPTQGTQQFRPPTQPQGQTPAQGTQQFRPPTPSTQGQAPTQGTQQFRPPTSPAQGQTPAQGKQQFRPPTPPTQGQAPTQGTQQFRPPTPPAQGQAPSQGTQQFRPPTPPAQGQAPTQGTQQFRPPTPPAQGQTPAQGAANKPTPPEKAPEQRRRRSDRHSNT
ncbi:MAG: SH3 domain-containing protein [Bacillota bacterium]|nr:SH3 domain-containing protein [Bacillota bacterium]